MAGRTRLLVGTLVVAVLVTACGSGGVPDSGTTSPPDGSVGPPVVSPAAEPVSLAELQAHVNSVIRWGWGPPDVLPMRCEGPDPVQGGSAVTCVRPASEPHLDEPVWSRRALVAVLDDDGRYAFTVGDPGLYAVPEDYAEGETDCAVLAAPIESAPVAAGAGAVVVPATARAAGPRPSYFVHYAALLYYWMASGSPGSMDTDGDGRPCEGEYKADEVERIMASPLSPRSPVRTDATMEDVRVHAEAVLSGTLHSLWLDHCATDVPATVGESIMCHTNPDLRHQTFDVMLVALDESGRYAMATYSGNVMVEDYPPGSSCADFAEPLEGWAGPPDTPGYADVLASWYAKGQPDAWDADGDGRPCEDAYPEQAIEEVFGSQLQP